MAEWVIENLQPRHDRAAFTCGQPTLDTFLRSLVTQYEKRRLGRTFIAIEPNQDRVAGFYTLAAGTLDLSSLPEKERKKLPKHPIPTIHLGRLAVDNAFRGRGLGETLLFHALQACLELSQKLGAFAVDVVAIDEAARGFYQKYGFIPLLDATLHLFLPMKTIEAIFAS